MTFDEWFKFHRDIHSCERNAFRAAWNHGSASRDAEVERLRGLLKDAAYYVLRVPQAKPLLNRIDAELNPEASQ